MSSNKYIKLAEMYMDNVARHYDPVPQESAIIDFAIWLDKHAAEHSVQRTVEACPDDRHMYYIHFLNYEFCPYCAQRLHSR